MRKFVSRGDLVVIKPNIGWDRMPIHAANTNPDVVGAVIKQAFDAGAKRVVVAGLANKIAVALLRLTPHAFILPMIERHMRDPRGSS